MYCQSAKRANNIKKTNIRYVSRGRTKRIRKSFFSLIIVIACDTQSPRVLPNHHLVLLSYYKFHEDACQQEINLSSRVNSSNRSAIPTVSSWDGGGGGGKWHLSILKSGLEKIPRIANDSSLSSHYPLIVNTPVLIHCCKCKQGLNENFRYHNHYVST